MSKTPTPKADALRLLREQERGGIKRAPRKAKKKQKPKGAKP